MIFNESSLAAELQEISVFGLGENNDLLGSIIWLSQSCDRYKVFFGVSGTVYVKLFDAYLTKNLASQSRIATELSILPNCVRINQWEL